MQILMKYSKLFQDLNDDLLWFSVYKILIS